MFHYYEEFKHFYRQSKGTGGGPAPSGLSKISQAVLELYEDSPSFIGIPNASETPIEFGGKTKTSNVKELEKVFDEEEALNKDFLSPSNSKVVVLGLNLYFFSPTIFQFLIPWIMMRIKRSKSLVN